MLLSKRILNININIERQYTTEKNDLTKKEEENRRIQSKYLHKSWFYFNSSLHFCLCQRLFGDFFFFGVLCGKSETQVFWGSVSVLSLVGSLRHWIWKEGSFDFCCRFFMPHLAFSFFFCFVLPSKRFFFSRFSR